MSSPGVGLSDAIVIGGGFYGAAIAVYLAERRGFKKIVLVEKEDSLLCRASYNNQARVHNGYHYPRSFTTAYRSRENLPRFFRDWSHVVKQDFTKLYAIARQNSKVTAKQFERFCGTIGASLEPATQKQRALFDHRLIEDIFIVQEYAFDSSLLAAQLERDLLGHGVAIRTRATAQSIRQGNSPFEPLTVAVSHRDKSVESLAANYVFNCTYSGLNQLSGDFSGVSTQLKHEITEMLLVDMPDELRGLGITVMDGPFFSMMPFPSRGLHSLSHVRYTPHTHWLDEAGVNPYEKMSAYEGYSRYDRMIRDVGRYVPKTLSAKYIDSLFEVKTVLLKNESNDGRPIFFEKHTNPLGCYSVLGGKIDNIYDIFEALEKEVFPKINQLVI